MEIGILQNITSILKKEFKEELTITMKELSKYSEEDLNKLHLKWLAEEISVLKIMVEMFIGLLYITLS